jgi:PadR family transcriptional regulator PadR
MKMPRITPETLLVMERFVERPTDWRHRYELSRETGLKSGTLYPILMRPEKHGLLEARWATTEDGVALRRTYRLTPNGLGSWSGPGWSKRARARWCCDTLGVREL